jgi:HSP20 family molecular chaperone IbpA
MSTPSTRTSHPFSDLLGWLEGDAAPSLGSFGLTPHVRVEDFVEDGEYVLRAELPGIDADKDLSVQVDGNILTIRGERSEETRTKDRHELHYGSFSRSVTLPAGVEAAKIRADYSDGVLELRAPIAEDALEPRTIPVQRRGE